MRTRGTLVRGFNQMVVCRMCGKRTHSSIDGCNGLDLCRKCRLECEAENAHNDYHSADNADAKCVHCVRAGWVK